MRSPRGQEAFVDSSEVKMFEDEGFMRLDKPWRRPVGGFPLGSPEARADIEQQIGGIRRGIGAALPVVASTLVGLGTGGPGGGLVGALRGLATEAAAAGAAKIPGSLLEKGRLPTAMEVATETGITGATGAVGRAIRLGVRHAPRPLMKRAIGNATPGAEDDLLLTGQAISNEGLAKANEAIKIATLASQAAIDASRRTFDWRILRSAVRGAQKGAEKADLASTATEKALERSLGVLESKIGPKVTTTPASKILAPGRGGVAAVSGPAVPATTTVGKAKRLSARDLEDIRKFADNEAKTFYDKRVANKDKVVGPEEAAYIKIAKTARAMLASIPEVKAARAAESAAIRRQKVVFEALKRAPSQQAALMTGGIAGGALGFGSDPIMAFPGVAFGYGLGLTGSSPSGISAMAHFANRPAVQEGVRHLPRALQLFLAESNALGGK
jgi:hypothetical protein